MFPLKSLASLLLGLLLLWALASSSQTALPYFKSSTGVSVEKGVGPLSAPFAGTSQIQIEVTSLPAGLYLLRVQGTNTQQTLKFLVTQP